MVSNIGKSLRFMMVELNKLMNLSFGTNYMPPNSSGVILQKMSMFIWGNKTWPIKFEIKELDLLHLPLEITHDLNLGVSWLIWYCILGHGTLTPYSSLHCESELSANSMGVTRIGDHNYRSRDYIGFLNL
jgi:hypothetical protein